MTTVLYTTPTLEYCIEKYIYPPQDTIIPGEELATYYIYKKKSQKKTPLESDWFLFREEETIEKCLKWFLRNKIISKDEYSYQLEKLTS